MNSSGGVRRLVRRFQRHLASSGRHQWCVALQLVDKTGRRQCRLVQVIEVAMFQNVFRRNATRWIVAEHLLQVRSIQSIPSA